MPPKVRNLPQSGCSPSNRGGWVRQGATGSGPGGGGGLEQSAPRRECTPTKRATRRLAGLSHQLLESVPLSLQSQRPHSTALPSAKRYEETFQENIRPTSYPRGHRGTEDVEARVSRIVPMQRISHQRQAHNTSRDHQEEGGPRKEREEGRWDTLHSLQQHSGLIRTFG